jgi:hypothetical protein
MRVLLTILALVALVVFMAAPALALDTGPPNTECQFIQKASPAFAPTLDVFKQMFFIVNEAIEPEPAFGEHQNYLDAPPGVAKLYTSFAEPPNIKAINSQRQDFRTEPSWPPAFSRRL